MSEARVLKAVPVVSDAPRADPVVRWVDAPNLSVDVGGTRFAYRDLGPRGGVPLVLFNHWGAVLDNFDPRIVDGLATRHRVIAVNYRGIGASQGTAPTTVDEMARDGVAMIEALGLEQVDVLGFSLGGSSRRTSPSRLRGWCASSSWPAPGQPAGTASSASGLFPGR